MRDAILVRKGVKVSKATSGTFNTLLRVKVGGAINVDVTRGWAAVDAKVNGRKVHVVDSHLEAFDSARQQHRQRRQDLPEGRDPRGPGEAADRPGRSDDSKLPTSWSVTSTPIRRCTATRWTRVTHWPTGRCWPAGWSERAFTPPPFGCCLQDPNLNDPSTAGITHRVDHIMSNSKKIKFKKGGLTTTYANGLLSSDHFGIWSRLQVK